MERFRFNPQTLSYQKIEPTGKQKLFRFLGFLGLTLSMASGTLILRDRLINSPRSERLNADQLEITYKLNYINRDVQHYEELLSEVAFNDDHIYRVYFEVDPWPATLRNAGVGGSNKYAWLRQYKYDHLLMETYQNSMDIATDALDMFNVDVNKS